jgi:hypothetical protein
MTVIVNPFDGGGYSLAEMTESINLLPNIYTRIGQMGLFREEAITQRVVLVEFANGTIKLLPSVPLGGPPTVAGRDGANLASFAVPWIPHDDVITPQDIQGVRGFGTQNADPLQKIMLQKLTRIRAKHAQTREYMEVNALRGILKDGAGRTLVNFHAAFGTTPAEVDFVLGTAATDVVAKVRAVLRLIEDNLQGESMSGARILVDGGFFDKMIGHASVKEAYKNFNAFNGMNPNRDDVRRMFPFGGAIIEEYSATVTLSTNAPEKVIPANEGIAFPMGTMDTFVTYFAPANLIETVNTLGMPLYARQIMRPNGSAVDVMTEASPLPVNKRPNLVVRVFSSN